MAPKYKVTYFDFKGYGETIRFLLSYMGEDFEDIRVQMENWPELKPHTPFGKLPVLEFGGKKYSESVSLYRYLGKIANLAGNNDLENLQIDIIADVIVDVRTVARSVIRTENEEEKKSKIVTLLNETLPFYFCKLEEIAKQNSGYLANNKLSWVDFMFASFIESITGAFEMPNLLDPYPTLAALQKQVVSLPKVKEWIEKRPTSTF